MRDGRPVFGPAACGTPRGADVIFDVTAAENAARVHVLEAREDIRGALSRDVHHDVQAAAMAHADHDLLGARFRGAGQHAVEQRNQRRHAFEGKSFAAQVARLQNLLEQVGANQPLEDIGAVGFGGV